MERASESGVISDSECNDPAVLLACALGSDGCPAKCQKDASEDETAKGSTIEGLAIAGDLNIAVADYSSSVKSAPAVGTVVFNAVDFKASEKVTIESVKLERTGLSSKSDIKGVWFEKDGMAVSAKASITSDGTATTRFYNGYSVNGTDTLDLVVELSWSAGSEIAFKIVDVTSTAKNVSFNTTTTTYRTTNYTVAQVSFKENGGTTSSVSYKLGEKQEYEIGKFQIVNENTASEDKDVVVKALKLKNDWKLDMASTFKNVKVYRDNKVVSKSVELNSKDMTIIFDNETLASWKKGIYTIYAEVSSLESTDDSVKLYLNKSSELVADESSTDFRVNLKDQEGTAWTLKEYYFKGWKINFTNDSSMAKTVEAAPSSTDVVIGKGTLTIAEPIKLENLVITGTLNTADKNPINTLKLEIGGSTYTANDPSVDWTTVVWKFTDELYISKTSDIRVLASIKSTADKTDAVNTFVSIKWSSFWKGTYENNDERFTPSEIIAGSIQISKVVPTAGKFYITNKSSTTQKVVVNASDEVTIFDGEITSNKDKVSVTDLILTWNQAITADGDQISLTLYVNGESYADAIYRAVDSARFSNLGDVSSGSSMKIKITAQPSISTSATYSFKVWAKGTDSEGNEAIATEVSSAKLEITSAADITVANATSSNTVEKDGTEAVLATFSTTVKNGSYEIGKMDIAVSGANANALSGQTVYLEFDGKRVSTTAGSIEAVTWGIIEFSSVVETLEIGKHDFKLLADIDTDAYTNWVALKVVSVKIDNKDAQNINANKLFVKAYPVLSLVRSDSTNNEITVKIANPEDSSEDLIVSALSFTNTAGIDTVSLNDQSITSDYTALIDANKDVTLAPGQSTELRWSVKDVTTNSAVALNAITVKISGESDEYTITDTYTNVAKWADLKITYKK